MKRFLMKKGSFLALGVLALTVVSCGSDEPADVIAEPVIETVEEKPVFQVGVPTPNEFFVVIRELKNKDSNITLSDPSKASTFQGAKSQAINFGIYSADLAYISTFAIDNKALEYFKALKQVGDKLNVANIFGETVFQKASDNINNGDSLMMLSNDTYFEAYNYLIENDRGPVLAMLVAGGWVESMYIVTSLVGEYKEGDETVQRIADQKLTLESIMEFMTTYADDPDVSSTMEDLADIEILFSELEVEELEKAETKKEGEVHMLSGGSKFIMDKAKYDQLKKMVIELRNKYVGITL